MPRASTKKPKAKGPKLPDAEQANGIHDGPTASNVAIAEPPPQPERHEPEPVEPTPPQQNKGDGKSVEDKDKIAATSLNIAKLQSMSMMELNQMARELNVENFGTMRKHEVIFHILQKNAERAGVLFSEGVLEVLPEGFGFLRSQSFNYLPCPE